MKLLKTINVTLLALTLSLMACNKKSAIYDSPEFVWDGNVITQDKFTATAESENHIKSNYNGKFSEDNKQREWKLTNNITPYTTYAAPTLLENAIYYMGLDEMINAVEPDSTLRTGKEWPGVWTRDVSYSIILSMAHMQTEVSKISLMHKVTPQKRIIQDTGTGGAWPCSTDRMIWASAAWEIYLVTGDMEWLKTVYPIICNSIEDDRMVAYDAQTGLMMGETSFIDWREQSYPRWMQPVDIYQSKAYGTNVIHANAMRIAARMAEIIGDHGIAQKYTTWANELVENINREFAVEGESYHASFSYGRNNNMVENRSETLGESLAILWDITPLENQGNVVETLPLTPYGAPIFYPFIADIPPYHNNGVWPFVSSYFGLASAKAGNEAGVLYTFATIYRAAAMFCTNKENMVATSGDYSYTEINSDNMLWSLSGNISMVHKVLFGMQFTEEGLVFNPLVPRNMAGERILNNFKYRNATLNITLSGHGNIIKSFKVDGVECEPKLATDISGEYNISIEMTDNGYLSNMISVVECAFSPNKPKYEIINNYIYIATDSNIAEYYIYVDGEKRNTIVNDRDTIEFELNSTYEGEIQLRAFDGKFESFATEPVRYYSDITIYEIEDYSPKSTFNSNGYRGSGFVALTNSMQQIITLPIDIAVAGTYAIDFRYANGNGPINTNNKCGIRSLFINEDYVQSVILPHRGEGEWDNYGWSNSVIVDFKKAGDQTLTLRYMPYNLNMNLEDNSALLDQLRITRID